MRIKDTALTWTGTSPAAASTAVAVIALPQNTLWKAEKVQVFATLTGATGGVLDIYIQCKMATNAWFDLVHFTQLAAAASKKWVFTLSGEANTVIECTGTDASPGVALAAGTIVNVIPTGELRVVYVAGAGTSLGAAQTIVFQPITTRS